MRIAIDCRSLVWKHSGIARYLHNVLFELAKIDKKNEYYLLATKSVDLSEYNFKNCTKINFTINDFIYKYWITPHFLKKESIDVYWSPTQDLPLWKPKTCKYICTVHDAAIEHDISPQSYKVKIIHFLGFYKRAVKLADIILTVSEFSKEDIVHIYNISRHKIHVTYLGSDNKLKKITKANAKKYLQDKYGIKSQYIFFINTGRPRNLFKAFALMIKELNNKKIILVVLGESAQKEKKVKELASVFGIDKNIYFINYHVSDEDLNNLYAGSEFFVSPSYYEGFGLTPLEALQCGSPILISNVTALPEIYKNAALYCEPTNVTDIKDKMILLYKNRKVRIDILRNSEKIFPIYSWENIVRKILTIFEEEISLE